MKLNLIVLLAFSCFYSFSYSQNIKIIDTTSIFFQITNSVKNYTIDTSFAPDDKITKKIIQLKILKGGFNIKEAIEYKIEEDRLGKNLSNDYLDSLAVFFNSGQGKQWLNNAVIWIYRKHFTYKELKQLVRFYKTSGGQKMANDFPLIMMQSLVAAETIKGYFTSQKSR